MWSLFHAEQIKNPRLLDRREQNVSRKKKKSLGVGGRREKERLERGGMDSLPTLVILLCFGRWDLVDREREGESARGGGRERARERGERQTGEALRERHRRRGEKRERGGGSAERGGGGGERVVEGLQ